MAAESRLLKELRQGKFKRVKAQTGPLLIIETYRTKSGLKVQVSEHIFGKWVYVNGIKQSKFTAWRICWAMRKGAYGY